MKKFVSLICMILLFSSLLHSQKKIKVRESSENIGDGQHNALTVNIYEASGKDVEKAWKKLMKDYKAKVSIKKEIFADDATIKSMSSNTVDIYAKAGKSKDGEVFLIVAVDLGGAFLSSSMHSDKFKTFKNILYDFAVKTTKEAIRGQLKDAEKQQEKQEKEQKQLVKDNENLHKDIENYKNKIARAEKDIEINLKDQETKKKEIGLQKKLVEEITEKEKSVK